MIPGYGSSRVKEENVASATTITVKADLVRITGSTQIETINSPVNVGRDGLLVFLVAVDGTVVLGTAGNIIVGQSLAVNRLYALVFSTVANKWYIHGVV